ncbi:MAG: hypothetical protein NVSMB31_02940 [Vulcanimicrobiaceae bacterium]
MRNVGIFKGGAFLAVLTAASVLAACGGGGGTSSGGGAPVVPITAPTATPPISASSSIPVGASSSSAAIPSVGGVSGTVALPAASTGAGATLAAVTSLVAPSGIPALLGHLRTLDTTTVYAYESFTPSATVAFASSPAFSITLPTGTNMSQTFYAAIYSGGWDKVHAQAGTVSAGTTTVNFAAQTGTYSLTGGTTYYFAFYGVTASVATPSAAPSLPPSTPPTATPAPTATPTHAPTSAPTAVPTPGPSFSPGTATCTSPLVNPPSGYGACDIQGAYNFPSAKAGTGQTIAIVDAYDDPKAEADLKIYRAEFGLPECSTANGCFKKIDQNGGVSYPVSNAGWIGEISLDVDMASAVCPNCKIILVEANGPDSASLETAVDTAVANGANVVSNSYGGPEDISELTVDDLHYNHPGVAIVASSGDNGYINRKSTCDATTASHECGDYPASSPYVTAVGGTSLTPDPTSARPWTETAWTGAGSYCSPFEPKPVWQIDTGCPTRMVADVSAVADPQTGVAVYDSTPDKGFVGGWGTFGGTSASAPIIGAAFALAGNASTINTREAPYKHLGALIDITFGTNFTGTCSPLYFCNAVAGYDGPTGLGVPYGTAALSVGRRPASFGISQNHGGPTQRGCEEATGRHMMACHVIMRTDVGGRFGILQ